MKRPCRLLSLLLCCTCAACSLAPAGPARRAAVLVAPPPAIPLPGQQPPPAQQDTPTPSAAEERPQPFYRSWWFWGAVGLAVIGGAAVAIGANLGGTDRVARGADGRFDPTTFPNRGATP